MAPRVNYRVLTDYKSFADAVKEAEGFVFGLDDVGRLVDPPGLKHAISDHCQRLNGSQLVDVLRSIEADRTDVTVNKQNGDEAIESLVYACIAYYHEQVVVPL